LCIAQDHQLLERMAHWLAELGHVEAVNNLAAADALVRRRGAPAVVLANPQAQGPADAFCISLLRLQQPARILLMSDALDEGFAAHHDLGWLPAAAAPRQEIINRVRSTMANKNEELPHGSV
jgi:hypothetical protein